MRIRCAWVAVLVLASLSCRTPPEDEDPHPERLRCPREHVAAPGAPPLASGCKAYDTEPGPNGAPRAGLEVCVVKGPPKRALIKSSRSGEFEVGYAAGGAISWEKLPGATSAAAAPREPAPAPLELVPPEVARVIPEIQPKVDAGCLARGAVSLYLGNLRDRMVGRWRVPKLGVNDDRNVVLSFSLSGAGEVTGACFERAANDALGASATRALFRSAPYDELWQDIDKQGKDKGTGTDCLAGRRLTGSFGAPR